jgi:uncharacterized protein (TIGR00251 family)
MSLLEIQEDAARGTVAFVVRVQPRASKNEISGIMQGVMRIRLCAPAVENRANEALVEFLAEVLKRPKSAVRIQGGEHSRTKRVEIQGVTRQQILDLVLQDA